MAERRMFAKTIIDSDAFLDMPISSQLLYFHLSMRADDDGFINKPKTIMRMIRATDDDMKLLITKKFILPFESGVVVIKHWRIHNYIRKDTYNETKYKDEKSLLELDENNAYMLPSTERIRNVDETLTQVRLGKVRLGKDSNNKGTSHFVPPSLTELQSFISEHGYNVNAETFINHYEAVGWRVGKNKMKDWKAAVRSWNSRNKEVKKQTTQRTDELPDWWNNESESKELIVDREKIINQIKKGESSE